MDEQPPELTEAVEVSDLRKQRAATSSSLLSSHRPRLTPRQRQQRLAVAGGSVLLALLILIAAVPGLRAGAGSWLAGFVPTPTATLPAGSDRYYFIASVPDIQLSIDGRSVSHLPRIGTDPPLVLARGQHHVSWKAAPFLPQSCIMSVPFGLNDTCGTPIPVPVPLRRASVMASIVLLRESLATLSADQQSAVVAAIQHALASFSSDIEPGDHYLLQTATQRLRGTLVVQLATANGPGADAATCLPDSSPPYVTCSVNSNNCTTFCTIPAPILANVGLTVTPLSWYVIAFAGLSFTISMLGGQTLIANGPISQGGLAVTQFGILIALTWNGAVWHAQPFLGSENDAMLQRLNTSTSLQNVQSLADLGCAAMPDFVGPNTATSGPPNFTYMEVSNPADGCLAVQSVPSASGTQKAYYLYRFGGLVAVNDLAHHLDPRWPVASAHERQITAAILSSGTPAP